MRQGLIGMSQHRPPRHAQGVPAAPQLIEGYRVEPHGEFRFGRGRQRAVCAPRGIVVVAQQVFSPRQMRQQVRVIGVLRQRTAQDLSGAFVIPSVAVDAGDVDGFVALIGGGAWHHRIFLRRRYFARSS